MVKILKSFVVVVIVLLLTSCGSINTTIEKKNETTGETEIKTIRIGYDGNNKDVVNSNDVKVIKYEIDGDYVGNYIEIIGIEDTLIKDKVIFKEYKIPIIIKNLTDEVFEDLNLDIKYFDSNDVLISLGKGSLKNVNLKPNEKARILVSLDDKNMKNRISSFEVSRLIIYERVKE